MDALDAVIEARKLLENRTPLRRDCGKICGAACCLPDSDGQGGMLLFPGEEKLYESLPEGFSIREDNQVLEGMKLLTCPGQCDREARPLSCRLFPLTPVLTVKNRAEKLVVRMDPRAFSVCPLAEEGLSALDGEFSKAVLECGRILCRCEEHRVYFKALNAFFEKLKSW